MIVLGLDLASHTGWSVLEGNNKLLASGTQEFKGKPAKKFCDFDEWIEKLLADYMPTLVVYERPHFRGYAATVIGVGLSTIMRMSCFKHGFPVIPVHTATLKSFATHYGKATKEQMTSGINAIFKDLNLKTKENNDEADAIWLALFGSNLNAEEIGKLQQ